MGCDKGKVNRVHLSVGFVRCGVEEMRGFARREKGSW